MSPFFCFFIFLSPVLNISFTVHSVSQSSYLVITQISSPFTTHIQLKPRGLCHLLSFLDYHINLTGFIHPSPVSLLFSFYNTAITHRVNHLHTTVQNPVIASFCPQIKSGLLCCCSVTQLCLTLCDAIDCSMPGFPVHHYLLEFAQTHIH